MDTDASFAKLLAKYEFPKRNGPTGHELLEQIEAFAALDLPEDYKHYLEHFKGVDQFIGHEFVNLWPAEELIAHNTDYAIVATLPHTLGIGSNGSGEFIALVADASGNFNVVLSPFTGLSANHHIVIGDSFADMLRRLDQKIDWFE